jgi:hypothetical protein
MGCSDLFENCLWETSGANASQYETKLCSYAVQFITMLAIQPELRRHTAKSFEAGRHFGSDRSIASQDAVKRLARDREISRRLTDR